VTANDPRLALANRWLSGLSGYRIDTLAPASADASFRRYFRLERTAPDTSTVILMDAPPDKEPVTAFLQVGTILRDAGLRAPEVYVQDPAMGFLLLEDFGTQTFLQQVLPPGRAQCGADLAQPLYAQAWRALIRAQHYGQQVPQALAGLPSYDADRLRQEMALFPEWYLEKHLGIRLNEKESLDLAGIFTQLVHQATQQHQVIVHRDYHSRNLMVLTDSEDLGILDFQDAVLGPLTYDLVSLLRDAYIDWPESVQIDWAARYWQEARSAGIAVPEDFGAFYADFELMGLQRHLKVLGIFARLSIRDGKHGYLNDIPRVLAYATKVAERYGSLAPLARILHKAAGTHPEVRFSF
jgi:aminoglycoside/choline kinase family phosphotransferase